MPPSSSVDPWQALTAGAEALGVPLSPAQLERFRRYTELLLAANQQFNLTAVRDLPGIIAKLHLDSLSLLPPIAIASRLSMEALRSSMWRVADVGSGAGIPGFPLLLACPTLQVAFIESAGKKGEFLRQVATKLGVEISVAVARAETLGQAPPHRESFDLVVARAVAETNVLAELTLPLARLGGIVVLPKGPKAYAELEEARPAIKRLGGEVIDLLLIAVPGVEETRTLILLRKLRSTPPNYPRNPGIPAKHPIC